MSEAVEAEIRRLCDLGDNQAGIETAIREYGGEVLGFLVARTNDRDAAFDVFSQTCEDLWKSSDKFEWRCSMRTWMYKLARCAAARYARTPANRRSRRGEMSRVSQVVAEVRSSTEQHLRTDVKDQFAEIRSELDPDDRTILVLRVDRDLSWNDVARVTLDDDGPSEEDLKRESARLRQRFQKIKDYLKTRATEMGMLGAD